jgi:protein TonB
VILAVVLAAVLIPREESEPPALLAPPATTSGEREAATPRADPVLSRARAALDAGRYESPEGRNALDLYRAVLLAKPDHVEARAGLERTLDAVVNQAEQRLSSGDRAEAERLVRRVLEAEPTLPAARALLARLEPPAPTPVNDATDLVPGSGVATKPEAAMMSAQEPAVLTAPVSVEPEIVSGTGKTPETPATAAPAAIESHVAAQPMLVSPQHHVTPSPANKLADTRKGPRTRASTGTVVPQPESKTATQVAQVQAQDKPVAQVALPQARSKPVAQVAMPQARSKPAAQVATSAPAATPPEPAPPRPRSTKPVPDPLQPKLAMTTPKRATARGRSFGAPISSGHAIAGVDRRPYVPEPARTTRAAAGGAASVSPPVPAARALVAAEPAPRPQPVYLDPSELELVSTVDPIYPAAAMRTRQEGWVTLEFTVTDTGSVRDPWVTDAEPADLFDAAAIAAVKQWRFKPRVANGRAVEVRSAVTLRFNVDR